MNAPARAALAVVVLYAVSGCGALMLETVWQRWFRLLFGATAPATSAALVAFLAGQALGAALAVRVLARVRRPFVAWGVLELLAALFSLAVPALLGAGSSLVGARYADLQGSPTALAFARFGVALAATLPTSVLLGAALPTVGKAWLAARRELATRGTALYACNLVGAASGAALAAFVLPPHLGVAATYAVGVAALVAAGAGALLLARRAGSEPPAAAEEPAVEAGPGLAPRGRVTLAALSGFGTFAFQVLLVRGLALVLDQSVLAFGAVLVVVLLSLALGAAGVSLLLSTTRVRPANALAFALALAGLGIAVLPAVLRELTSGFDAGSVAGGAASALGLAALCAGPALLAAGAVLPLLFAAAGRSGEVGRPEVPLGRLLAVNTAGAIAGAVAAPFLLLELLPLWSAFLVVAFLYAVAAIFVPVEGRRARMRRDVGLGFAWIAVLVRASPLDVEPVRTAASETLVHVRSEPQAVVAVIREGPHLSLRTDGHYDLGGSRDLGHQERQGRVAALLRPDAERALWIGSATGISAGALLAGPVPPLDRLALVELVPGVADAAARFFSPWNRGVHADPRVRLVLDDARNYVRAGAGPLDLVVADLFVPWRAGTGSLYTREHFEAVRRRLAPDGAFVQWLPLYQLSPDGFASIAATFRDVFETSALFRGDFFGRFPVAALVGWAGAPPLPEAVADAARRLASAGEGDRWVRDPVGLWSLYVGPLVALDPMLEPAPRNLDDRPWVEYGAPRARARSAAGKGELLVGDRWVHATEPAVRAIGPADPVFPTLPPAARRAARAGAALQAAGAAWVAGRTEEAAARMTAAAPALPEGLLDPAAPDDSVAELWPDAR